MRTWAEAAVALVLWLGVAALLWGHGAWIALAAMNRDVAEHAVETIIRGALVIVVVSGILTARRSRTGYLLIAGGALASLLAAARPAILGSTGTVGAAIAGVTALAALATWVLAGRDPGPASSSARAAAEAATGPRPRSHLETATAVGLTSAGLVVLGRALIELVDGLAELPGASEHGAGDVILWLIFVLPIPVLAGSAMLAAAAWVWHRRAGTRSAAAIALIVLALAAGTMIVDGALVLGQGSAWRLVDDPLLWAPIGAVVGAVVGAGFLAAAALLERGTTHRPG